MADTGNGQYNASFSVQKHFIPSVTTTDATNTTVFSVPVPQNTSMLINLNGNAYKSDFANAYSGSTLGVFVRGTGNVAQSGTLVKNIAGALGGSSYDLVANTATQSVDIKVKGPAGSTVVWNLSYEINYNI